MIELIRGAVETVVLNVSDELQNLTDLTNAEPINWQIYREFDREVVLLTGAATVDPDNAMQALCLVDTSTLPSGRLELYAELTAAPDQPILGPFIMKIEGGTQAGVPDSIYYQPKSEKAQPNGYASLDSSGRVPAEQVPGVSGEVSAGDFQLLTKRIVIPHAQILTLYSHAVVLVEPTEVLDYIGVPTTIPIPLSCMILAQSGGGAAYDAGGAPYFYIELSTGEDRFVGHSVQWGVQNVSSWPNNANTGVGSITPFAVLPSSGQTQISGIFEFFEPQTGDLNGNLQDNGLVLSITVEGGGGRNPTGGDPSDKLIVFLTYYIAEL